MSGFPGLGQQVRELRLDRGLTQAQLAELVGVAWATIQRIEKDKTTPSLSLLAKVAQTFGVTVSALLPQTDPPTIEEWLYKKGFTEDSVKQILQYMAFVRWRESLPPDDRT